MKTLNNNEIVGVAGGNLAARGGLLQPIYTSLPAIVVLPTTVYVPSPTFDPGVGGQDVND